MELDYDLVEYLEREIMNLGQAIAEQPDNASLHLQRAKLYYKLGTFDKALNGFLRVQELDNSCKESKEYADIIREIFEFRHIDIYNP